MNRIKARMDADHEGMITVEDIKIGRWRGLEMDASGATSVYRAAYVGECVLTGPQHASLSDADLLAEAVAEARRGKILCWGQCSECRARDERRELAERLIAASDEGGIIQAADMVPLAPGDRPDLYTTMVLSTAAHALGVAAEVQDLLDVEWDPAEWGEE